MELEKTPNSQRNVGKENQSWRHHNARLQAILQNCNHQDSMVPAQKQIHRSKEQNGEPRNGPSTIGNKLRVPGGKVCGEMGELGDGH